MNSKYNTIDHIDIIDFIFTKKTTKFTLFKKRRKNMIIKNEIIFFI